MYVWDGHSCSVISTDVADRCSLWIPVPTDSHYDGI